MKKRVCICFLGLICLNLTAQTIDWREKEDLPGAMRGTAVACGDKIYFMQADQTKSGVWEYDPVTDSWTEKAEMITPGWNVNLAEVAGIIYAVGGDPFRNRTEAYNPVTDTWTVRAPMPTPRQHSNSCVVDNKIYVMGGITSWTKKTAKNEVYDPKTNTWQSLSPLPFPFENPIIASVDEKIYALCGNQLWVYDTYSDQWEEKENCPAWVSIMFGSAVIGNNIIIPGGQNVTGQALSTVYIYNTREDEWSVSTDLPGPIQLGGIAVLGDKLFMIGGCSTDFSASRKVYEGTLED